jgi:cellulose synthase/poly-beta-1,6-N-acetylglucosamine synthase-like glycosyltransferase
MHPSYPYPDAEPEISVVVPLYNEVENVAELHRRLALSLDEMRIPYEILFINDGSRDATASLIDALQTKDSRLSVIHLSRNFGHQPASILRVGRSRSSTGRNACSTPPISRGNCRPKRAALTRCSR